MRTEETSVKTPRLKFLRNMEAHFCKAFLFSCVLILREKDITKCNKEQREYRREISR